MKKIVFLSLLLITCFQLQAQSVKRWKMDDLLQYIHTSDSALVINFWATFCGPCIEEIPYFQTIGAKYKNQKVKLLLVSLDFKEYYPQKIEAFAKRFGFTAEIVWLDEEKPDDFCPKIDSAWSGAMPATLFVNNKTGYRRFIEAQLSPVIFETNLVKLFSEGCPDTLPVSSGFINDFEDLLSKEQEDALFDYVNKINSEKIAQIAVVTTDNFYPYDSIFIYAFMLGNCWGVGDKNTNNGMLIVLSESKRKVWISNGYGIETKLSNEVTKEIIDFEMIPQFKNQKYYEGLMNGIKAIENKLKIKEE
jgi:thiol-disulfide isomerase/thioredoxin